MEILRFRAEVYVKILRTFGAVKALVLARQSESESDVKAKSKRLQPYLRKEIQKRLAIWAQNCKKLGLSVSADEARRLEAVIGSSDLTFADFEHLESVLESEFSQAAFFSLPRDRVAAFQYPFKGWKHALQKFPDSQDDIEEMNKCFALSRYTAAVFHSLLVVEHGLITLGHHIGVSDPKPGSDATYKELNRLVNNRAAIPANLDFNFLEQTKARLDSMKLAWRNKVNHAAGRLVIEKTGFSDVSAEEVIIACRSFMRHLAEGLPK